jgi:IclR family transcriptional regulator, KDG regulon repressor
LCETIGDDIIQIIDRVFDIIELLAVEKDGLGVTEIGLKIGLHKSTVHRILNSLISRGYVEKAADRAVYKLGVKVVELSSIYLNRIELKTEARPYLWELTSKYNLICHLAILDGLDAVYIDKVSLVSNISIYSQIGKRIPVHCSSLGKALLLNKDENTLKQLFMGYEFTKYTKYTITCFDGFINELKQAKDRGWAVDNEEHELDIRCIASPIYDYRRNIIAAISIAGPKSLIPQNNDINICKDVIATSKKISAVFGYTK